jgi:hypothetical protein
MRKAKQGKRGAFHEKKRKVRGRILVETEQRRREGEKRNVTV